MGTRRRLCLLGIRDRCGRARKKILRRVVEKGNGIKLSCHGPVLPKLYDNGDLVIKPIKKVIDEFECEEWFSMVSQNFVIGYIIDEYLI